MNQFDDLPLDINSWAYGDLTGNDSWDLFVPIFGSLTVVGATNYLGRYRIVGKSLEFQVKFSAATSIASVAGTDYLTLPKAAAGYAGLGTMANSTTKVAVGICHFDITNSRMYLPAQAASGNTFTLAGSYEV